MTKKNLKTLHKDGFQSFKENAPSSRNGEGFDE
jgi:hypothetical protein